METTYSHPRPSNRRAWAWFAILLFGSCPVADATLIDRGNGLVFDDVLDVTWLQDADLAGGTFGFTAARSFVENLVFAGFDDWRLPSMDLNGDGIVMDCGSATELECRDNELGYMFYQNLNGAFGDDKTGNQVGDGGVTLLDIQSIHWSGTDFLPDPNRAWAFSFFNGFQGSRAKGGGNFVWAVRPGDSLATPEPGTAVLLGLCLIAAFGFGRQRL